MVFSGIFFKHYDLYTKIIDIYFEILKGDRHTIPPGKVFNFVTLFGINRPQLSLSIDNECISLPEVPIAKKNVLNCYGHHNFSLSCIDVHFFYIT